MRRLAFVAAALAAGCAHLPPGPPVATVLGFPPPPALSAAVEVLCDGHMVGHAAPVSATSAVTAYHVIDGCITLGWRSRLKSGRLLPLARGEGSDWALVLAEDSQFDAWFSLANRPPSSGEVLWWLLLLPGDSVQAAAASGPYIAEGRGDPKVASMGSGPVMYVDGAAWPGSSGSPIVNAAGELEGVCNGWYFRGPFGGRAVAWGIPVAQVFRR